MDTFNLILAIFGVLGGIPIILFILKYMLFRHNCEFHAILKSFSPISDNKINHNVKTEMNTVTKLEINKIFTEYAKNAVIENKYDEFISKLNKLDCNKFIFKKEKISKYIANLNRLYNQKQSKVTITGSIKLNGDIENLDINTESFDWNAFNYIVINKVLEDEKHKNELFVCKFFGF